MAAVLKEDPRRSDEAHAYQSPINIASESEGSGTSMATMLSMSCMMLRNKYIAWFSIFLAVNAFVRQKPSDNNVGSKSPWMNLTIALSALMVCYVPLFFPPAPRSTPVGAPPPSPA